jgi:hypothetical protein
MSSSNGLSSPLGPASSPGPANAAAGKADGDKAGPPVPTSDAAPAGRRGFPDDDPSGRRRSPDEGRRRSPDEDRRRSPDEDSVPVRRFSLEDDDAARRRRGLDGDRRGPDDETLNRWRGLDDQTETTRRRSDDAEQATRRRGLENETDATGMPAVPFLSAFDKNEGPGDKDEGPGDKKKGPGEENKGSGDEPARSEQTRNERARDEQARNERAKDERTMGDQTEDDLTEADRPGRDRATLAGQVPAPRVDADPGAERDRLIGTPAGKAVDGGDHDKGEHPLRPGDVDETPISFWEDEAIKHFRAEWHEVKAEFVDDPVAALTRAHDLLTDAVNELTESLLAERDELDPLHTTSSPDTESMRMAMRGYREFLDRILSL